METDKNMVVNDVRTTCLGKQQQEQGNATLNWSANELLLISFRADQRCSKG